MVVRKLVKGAAVFTAITSVAITARTILATVRAAVQAVRIARVVTIAEFIRGARLIFGPAGPDEASCACGGPPLAFPGTRVYLGVVATS